MRIHLLLAVALLAPLGAEADCGGADRCCAEPGALYVCRRVSVSAISVPSATYVRPFAGYQAGDATITIAAGGGLGAPSACTLESGNSFRLSRNDTNFELLLSVLQAAKLTNQVIDLSAVDAAGSCRIDIVKGF